MNEEDRSNTGDLVPVGSRALKAGSTPLARRGLSLVSVLKPKLLSLSADTGEVGVAVRDAARPYRPAEYSLDISAHEKYLHGGRSGGRGAFGVHSVLGPRMYECNSEADWTYLAHSEGEAELRIPPGKEILLSLRKGSCGPSVFKSFEKPDELAALNMYAMYASHFPNHDTYYNYGQQVDLLAHIKRFSGLKELIVRAWIRGPSQVLYLPELASVERLGLDCCYLGDTGLSPILPLPRLEVLVLCNCGFTDRDVGDFSALENLRHLGLFDQHTTSVSGSRLGALRDLRFVRSLDTYGLVDKGWESLKHWPALQVLQLGHLRRTGELSLGFLPELPMLRELSLSGNRGLSGRLDPLMEMPHLNLLDLTYTDVKDADLRCLGNCTSLRTLRLDSTPISDEGLSQLSGLTELRDLKLYSCKVSCRGTSRLNCLKLERLQVGETDDEGLSYLKRFDNLRELFLGPGNITDAGLRHLEHFPLLRRMYLPPVEAKSAARLRSCYGQHVEIHAPHR